MSWKRKFFTIFLGQTFSLIGSSAVQFSLIWWISSETGSAILMGLAGMAAFLPAALFSPAAGVAADRYDRKRICIAADLFIGAVAALFALLLWKFNLPMWTALFILFFRGIGNTFHQPALQAMIPQFVPQDQLVRVGGWSQMISSGSFLLGPAIGAALYAVLPLPAILLTDLAGALIASGLLAAVKIDRLPPVEHAEKCIRKEIQQGIEVFQKDRGLMRLILVETVCMIFYLPLASFYPLMTSSYFGADAWHGSVVEILYAAGMMVSAALFGSVIQVKRHLLLSYLGLFGAGIISAVCGLLPPQMWAWSIFAVACGVLGAFGNVHSIPLVAYMQQTIEPEKMGRAFSLIALLSSLTMPVGLLVGSPLAEILGVHMWFLIAGLGIAIVSGIGILLYQVRRCG